ncbi:6-phospho-3-hexuloisomerase [Paenibacillus sp. HB172176]|uniref:6-phospho-3-hexuloisomerase n=1 Tax=Paenibacillus sp. HB172176 TaxID=2493690 RepID=UPI00143BB4E4|nr:6-phospho-3-hexuloisomerase [Paenibacillus sp. HB172176]
MQTVQYVEQILKELRHSSSLISDDEAKQLLHCIHRSPKVFVAGAGRSGLMMRAFAMRMMQMGIEAYVVGETSTPNLDRGDLFILGSGSGETKSLVGMAEKARGLGGEVGLITISPESTLGRLANFTVQLQGTPKNQLTQMDKTIQPMGALFEQSLFLFCDALILKLMEMKEIDSAAMFSRHANLE